MNHLENFDKDFWRQSPDGVMAILGGKGTNLQYRFLDGTGKNVFHHYCMWGYDIHFHELIAKGSGGAKNPEPPLKKGKRFRHHYVLEPLSDAESKRLLRDSEEHPWRQGDQMRLDHVARYNPGLNQFQEHLGRQDDGGFFRPTSQCFFLPEHPGRRSPGCLCIDNRGGYQPAGIEGPQWNAWTMTLGSDNWHTPIESGVHYEISVWVRLQGTADLSARIAMQYITQVNQGKTSWKVKRSRWYSSKPVGGKKTGWENLVLKTPRLPKTYVCSMPIALEVRGRGKALFDEFEVRRLTR
jgi:hypothetical protein